VIDLSRLNVIRRVEPSDIAPRGLAVTFEGKSSSHRTKTQAMARSSVRRACACLRRIHIGESPEFTKINPAGDRLCATSNPVLGGADLREPRKPARTAMT
jgi:hypothetical protein